MPAGARAFSMTALPKAGFMLSLVVCIGCMMTSSPVAEAQQLERTYRIGWLSPHVGSATVAASIPKTFLSRLRDHGYADGRNVEFVIRLAQGMDERLPSLAADLVAHKPDVIVAVTSSATRAAKAATTAIPIVMVRVSDPVGSGFVASLAQPRGNVTGAADFELDLCVKELDLIHALVPQATRIAVLMSDNPVHPRQLRAVERAATSLGVRIVPIMDRSPNELEEAFATIVREHAGALIVLGGSPQFEQMERVVAFEAKHNVPTIWPNRLFPEKGGLISIGPSDPRMFALAAEYVDKVLRGTRPADLPVQLPTEGELVINKRTAQTLGIAIPPSLLLRADEVMP